MEDHVTEKKEQEPIGLSAFQLISRYQTWSSTVMMTDQQGTLEGMA